MDTDTIILPKTEWSHHDGITYGMLDGRIARCPYCKNERPSTDVCSAPAGLAFFEYRGPGNGHQCDVCRVVKAVHDGFDMRGEPLRPNSVPGRMLAQHPKHDWTDAEGAEFDSFYCGCRGWD